MVVTITAISGSSRKGSFNSALLRAGVGLMPAGSELLVQTIEGIPVYDGDHEEREGIPAKVQALKDQVANSHGLLIATPEYNNSIPGPLKNAIDWMTRPPDDIARVFKGKPVAVIGATPGSFGTILSQDAWLPVLRYLRTVPWYDGRLLVSGADELFDAQSNLSDEKTREKLRRFLSGFVEFVQMTIEGAKR